jgi:hypothetical protein
VLHDRSAPPPLAALVAAVYLCRSVVLLARTVRPVLLDLLAVLPLLLSLTLPKLLQPWGVLPQPRRRAQDQLCAAASALRRGLARWLSRRCADGTTRGRSRSGGGPSRADDARTGARGGARARHAPHCAWRRVRPPRRARGTPQLLPAGTAQLLPTGTAQLLPPPTSPPPAQHNSPPPAQRNSPPPAQRNFSPPAQRSFSPPAQHNFSPPASRGGGASFGGGHSGGGRRR